MIFWLLGYLLLLVYCFWMVWVLRGIQRLASHDHSFEPTVSIIVPIRNEAPHIVACIRSLIAQSYPDDKLDIWVVDDGSTDHGLTLLQEHLAHANVHTIRLANEQAAAPKKAAIAAGIAASQGEIIVTIDGDCQAAPEWLRVLTRSFSPTIGMVAGWVTIDTMKAKTLFTRIQALEFLGLVTAGAGAIAMNTPLSVNGANLAYRRAVFQEVSGFQGQEYLASGDDVLLMRKMHEHGWSIAFEPDAQAMVATEPAQSWSDFYQQRKRWASKGLAYHHIGISALLTAIYLFYLFLLIAWPLMMVSRKNLWLALPIFCAKFSLDFWLLRAGARFTGQTRLLRYFPLAELWQIPCIVLVGLAAIFKSYRWKGRKF